MERVGANIDRDVMEAALARAGKEGRGVAELIEDAVRSYLDAVGERNNPDEEATAKLAEEAVRRARSEAPERGEESPAPSPEEVGAGAQGKTPARTR